MGHQSSGTRQGNGSPPDFKGLIQSRYILPTSGVTMGVLGLAGISWEKWIKWMLPARAYFFVLALVLLIPPFLFGYK